VTPVITVVDEEVTDAEAVVVTSVAWARRLKSNATISEGSTAFSLDKAYLASLGRREYQAGIIPSLSLSYSASSNAASVLSLSSQVLGIAVARIDLSQLGYNKETVRIPSEVAVGRAGSSVGVEVAVLTTTSVGVTVTSLVSTTMTGV
jgi:hypothetical protein